MSRLARFDSFRGQRLSLGSALVLGIFGIVFLVGGLLGVSVWQHPENWPRTLRPPAEIEASNEIPTAQNIPSLGRYSVDVLRVIDGDTFEARVHLWPGHDLTTRVRLRGVDAPELKARCDNERVKAEAALIALRGMLQDRDVSIWNVGPDKYFGRIVAEAGTRRTPDISNALIAKGVARSYGGGHRDGWCNTASLGG
jgi:endonuclease YncB( thermonuclease family)